MGDKEDKGTVSRGGRFFRLAGMTASVASKYASTKVKGVFIRGEKGDEMRASANKDIGERIAKTLGELKGAAMKIGQMASVGSEVLPKEIQTALQVLQREAPPVKFSVIEEMIESELGIHPLAAL